VFVKVIRPHTDITGAVHASTMNPGCAIKTNYPTNPPRLRKRELRDGGSPRRPLRPRETIVAWLAFTEQRKAGATP
jgi:hypothetical protein